MSEAEELATRLQILAKSKIIIDGSLPFIKEVKKIGLNLTLSMKQ